MSLRDEGVFETAFPVAVSPGVLDALAGSGISILGGDFWAQDDGGRYRPTYENWYINRAPEEPVEDYARRSIDRARDAVGHPRRTRYFVTFTCTFAP